MSQQLRRIIYNKGQRNESIYLALLKEENVPYGPLSNIPSIPKTHLFTRIADEGRKKTMDEILRYTSTTAALIIQDNLQKPTMDDYFLMSEILMRKKLQYNKKTNTLDKIK